MELGCAEGNSLQGESPAPLAPFAGPPKASDLKGRFTLPLRQVASVCFVCLPFVGSFAFLLPCFSSVWATAETSLEVTESAGHLVIG